MSDRIKYISMLYILLELWIGMYAKERFISHSEINKAHFDMKTDFKMLFGTEILSSPI